MTWDGVPRRESDRLLSDLSKKIDDKADEINKNLTIILVEQATIKATSATTLEQAKRTNGRVDEIEVWKENKTGEFRVICWAISILSGIVVALIISHFTGA